jgi:hypothetical protein
MAAHSSSSKAEHKMLANTSSGGTEHRMVANSSSDRLEHGPMANSSGSATKHEMLAKSSSKFLPLLDITADLWLIPLVIGQNMGWWPNPLVEGREMK